MRTWEQTWLLLPLDSGGGLLLRGKGCETKLSTATTAATDRTTDTLNVVRTTSEHRSNDTRETASEKPGGGMLSELTERLLLLIIAIGVSLLIIKHKKE